MKCFAFGQPFYGGKKHRISAEVFSPPPTKKSILTVSGEWNGLMTSKCSQTGKTQVFVDTKAIPIIKKQVKPIGHQEEYESRYLWKEVTAALKKQDVSAATTAKYAVEQRQRELVKERQEKGVKWDNKVIHNSFLISILINCLFGEQVFHSLGENWNYNNPLTKRK